ncbi:Ig-like domain-containing protein [Saccharopolyspora sp. TS4A08]|uniref:Ig-like domain-containing protein n=1 Tax=Saccharopolyspora ipomoeae TaxID=3042027 RepID=A0ABT6PR17_9PSEU|nr:Ig-like domain-containing protein [Saccharopolyspora sp. TS4A08]MDI2029891.1 Ig-like domain-containing protein [Saccharopolyspora sp. TS4A08]
MGAVSTSGNTTLNAGSVVSTATGNVASLSLINNLVQVQVLDSPTITATSDGTTGTVTADDYSVAVTIAGQTTVLTAGMSIPINLDLGFAQTNLTLSVGELQDNSVGATASGSMDFLNLSGSISAPLLGQIANLDLGLLPLSATATAPEGGVECDRVDAPTITSPLDGSTVTDNPPTITGTGVPGAEVTVYDNGQPIGTTTVNPDGTWTFTPTEPWSPGDHQITATQSGPDGATSDPSNSVTVTVPGPPAPEPPVITSPATGTTVDDTTPPITGTGEPGATVTVYDNGRLMGTAVVNSDGTWTFTPSEPLSCGEHTITATQTTDARAASEASAPVTITVACPSGGTGDGGGVQQTSGSGGGSTAPLAQTGSPVDVGLLGLLGVLLMLGGATAVHRTRKTKS